MVFKTIYILICVLNNSKIYFKHRRYPNFVIITLQFSQLSFEKNRVPIVALI